MDVNASTPETTPLSDAELKAIRARWVAATENLPAHLPVLRLDDSEDYADFEASAPADIAALLAEVERLRNALRIALDECRNREMPPSFRLAETEKALRAATPDAPPPDREGAG